MKSTERLIRSAMTEFLPHTLWGKQKGREARRSANTGQRKKHWKALTCHFQSWEKLPWKVETQEIMGWPHVPSSISTRAHQLKTESSSLHRLDCSQGKNIGTEVDIKLSTAKLTNEGPSVSQTLTTEKYISFPESQQVTCTDYKKLINDP